MSPGDSNSLLQLARDKSVQGRIRLSAEIADLFSDETRILGERERALMIDIIHKLIFECEAKTRALLAKRISKWPELTRDLAVQLANQEIDIAYPILVHSGILEDEDLVSVVKGRTEEHQLAIAIRQAISEPVSDALVQEGHPKVIAKLLANPNATISRATMEYLVDESRRVDEFREPILRRKDLPGELAQRMFLWVAAALREHILGRYPLDAGKVDDLLEQTVMDLILSPEEEQGSADKAKELAEELKREGTITPDLLVELLEDGEVHLFTTMFVTLSGIREPLVKRIMTEVGGEGLAIACKGLGFTKVQFATIFGLTRKAHPKEEAKVSQEIRKALKFYEEVTLQAAQKVLMQWRRNSDYLSAIWEVQSHRDGQRL
ncbi:MAG: DUF2336 domain-containing protein [Rhodospirillales bacterium]|nr:DUF2336 domain-containing protein [Rhodospirillales bacterium]